MKTRKPWFQLYPHDPAASNLSVAAGAVRLVSVLLGIAAVLCTLTLLVTALRLGLAAGFGPTLLFLLDELGETVVLAFALWAGVVACRYAGSVLQGKASLLAGSQSLPPQAEP